ncbi:unnamed protein product [Chrysoparadoxa australica]
MLGEQWVKETDFRKMLEHVMGLEPWDGNPEGLKKAATYLQSQLESLGFTVERASKAGQRDILLAKRPPVSDNGATVGFVGHYDVEAINKPDAWRTEPWAPTVVSQNQLYGRGTADNWGPLAHRLMALREILPKMESNAPGITWLLHGEEEIGSPWAMEAYGQLLASGQLGDVEVWVDETGYCAAATDGTLGRQKLLIKNENSSVEDLIPKLEAVARKHHRDTVVENRFLTKFNGEDNDPVLKHLVKVPSAPYVGIGINDSWSAIHSPNESIPLDTLAMAAEQLEVLLQAYGSER